MPTTSPHTLIRVLCALGLVSFGIVVIWYGFFRTPQVEQTAVEEPEPSVEADPPPPDPRVTFPTPFRNVKPEVRYVGDATCSVCHAQIDKSYHAHPMGRSADLVTRVNQLENYDPATRNTVSSGPYTLRAEKTPTGVTHHVAAKAGNGTSLPEYVSTADLTIGSGSRGRSYLTMQQGALWQSPLSWFANTNGWELSPGFDLGSGGRRPIAAECMFCHVDRVEAIPGAINRFREPMWPGVASIGCERCHGPGELHVAERNTVPAQAGLDTSIVNPKRLPLDLRAAICEQCHLQGQDRIPRRGRDIFEFRPGLPLEQFVTVFVRHPGIVDLRRSVGQFEQMERSRCFTASEGKLECTSCHDPHATPTPATRDAYFRGKCLSCHETKGCSEQPAQRQSKLDSCIACHMPRGDSTSIAHASVTDHRIARKPAPAPPRGMPPGTVPLVAYRTGKYTPPEPELERDLGIVLAWLSAKPLADTGVRGEIAIFAENRLTASLIRWPGDVQAWNALSMVRGATGQHAARLQSARKAARLAPDSEVALTELADAALATNETELAATTAGRLIEMSPTSIKAHFTRATAHAARKNWALAESDCQAALRIQPLYPPARVLLGICRHQLGDPDGGKREADLAASLATSPQQRTVLLAWFERDTRK